jgi:hypothetical protein
MIVTMVVIIIGLILGTEFNGLAASLVTLAFLAFFFLYLLRLLNVISSPFNVGQERTDDDVSLFLLHEFVVHAQAGDEGVDAGEDIEAAAADIEEQLEEIEDHDHDDAYAEAKRTTEALTGEALDTRH